jgi:hypothetical protein
MDLPGAPMLSILSRKKHDGQAGAPWRTSSRLRVRKRNISNRRRRSMPRVVVRDEQPLEHHGARWSQRFRSSAISASFNAGTNVIPLPSTVGCIDRTRAPAENVGRETVASGWRNCLGRRTKRPAPPYAGRQRTRCPSRISGAMVVTDGAYRPPRERNFVSQNAGSLAAAVR